eukprot:Nitzschia sp. Nitz4//scaffold19_size178191//131487//132628//NITZ4_002000-RA/size178191-augustus-gene-0.73-mRNA-1//1//CDS//3329540750//32//frame0
MENPITNTAPKVSASKFYRQYHGHPIQLLESIYPTLRNSCDSLIWTAGDSSLDNKYWFNDFRPSVGAYSRVLSPPQSNADVTYWLNFMESRRRSSSEQSAPRRAAINTAVEASTLNSRTFRLLPQDKFLRDNISSEDILIVSVGGNDVAMAPLPCTILSVLSLVMMPTRCLENAYVCTTAPCDDYCCGCGPSTLSCACSCPPCLGYMIHLFGTRTQRYVERLTAKTKPKKILVCMIYYPDEAVTQSWAGPALAALGYNATPQRLQTMIQRAFVEATSKIRIQGTEVIPVFLPNALDGKDSRDYVARVEPSSHGGRKMAEYLLDAMDTGSSSHQAVSNTDMSGQSPVQAYYMADR